MRRLVKGKAVYILSCVVLFNVTVLFSQNTNELLRLGKIAYENQDYDDAIEMFSKSIENTPEYSLTSKQYFWYAKALFHDSRLNYFQSLDMLDKAIAKDTKYSEAYFLRARIREFLEGESSLVLEDYKKANSYADKGYQNNIFIKSISIAYSKSSAAGIFYLEDIIDYLKTNNNYKNKKVLGECYYALATIYSKDDDKMQSLLWLNSALVYNIKPTDFMFIDFYKIRKTEGFLTLMENNNVPPLLYQVENTDELKKVVSMGDLPFRRSTVIKRYVEKKINTWQKKGKFEKTVDYQKRVSEESRKQKINYYTQKAIDSIGYSKIDWGQVSNEYDADNESFKVSFSGFEPLYVGVPLPDAPSFDANFDSLEFSQVKFVLLDDYTTEIAHIEITNSEIGKTYIYSNTDNVLFNSAEFTFNFDELEVPIQGVAKASTYGKKEQNTKIISIGKSDVDTNIPVTAKKNKNAYALIIGNEDYTKYQTDLGSESNVDFAIRDAEIFAEYAEKTLGVPKENITVLKDAISSQMQREIEKISKIAMYHNGEANIIFYYAGHGFPDEKTKESYLMPVDISGANVNYGIKLSFLYQQLTKYPSQKVLVILDACFSGGGRNQGLLAARGVQIKPRENVINGNLVVFSSSTGEQSSLPYANKQHGMFTYFLLKKLKESKGNITLEELSDYVTKEVQISALKFNSKEQNPKILVSPDVGNLWMDWKLN
ncbi:MAG: hypothetical protein DRI89_11320 [Bacteroidetes bacterium]|nr:MAG: hypothetical protein DRI89_11320 [Bacteroidota bacterium]